MSMREIDHFCRENGLAELLKINFLLPYTDFSNIEQEIVYIFI